MQQSRSADYDAPDPPLTKLRHNKTVPTDGSEASEDVEEEAQSFSESLLDISLRRDRELVLVSPAGPDMKRDSAAIGLNYKGITFLEETVDEGELPYHLREVRCQAKGDTVFR